MKKLESLNSSLFEKFKEFSLSSKESAQIKGGRTVEFIDGGPGVGCAKHVDTNDGETTIKIKLKARYEGKC
jgi:hypothetical protein